MSASRYISIIFELLLDVATFKDHFISMNIEIASSQLEALGSPVRLGIYRILVRTGNNGLAVGQLQEQVEMPASTLSHHLKRLIDTGLVRQERAGTSLICHAEYPAMDALLEFLTAECCVDERRPADSHSAREVATSAAS